MTTFIEKLTTRFPDRVRRDVLLAPMTTFKVGGPADVLFEAHAAEEVREASRSPTRPACRSPCWAAARTSSSAIAASAGS